MEALNVIQLVSERTCSDIVRGVLDLCGSLDAAGHSVAVITRGYEAVDGCFTKAGFTPGRLPLGGPLDLITPMRLSSILGRIAPPVVVHVHSFKDARNAVMARRLCRQPQNVRIVATRHMAKPAGRGSSDRELYARIDDIVFESDAALGQFLSSAPDVDRARLHVLRPGIPALPPLPAKECGTPHIVFAGPLVPEKGIDVLVDALCRISDLDWRATIAGEGKGSYVLPLMRRCRECGMSERIEWPGILPLSDIPALMESAHVAVLPSRTCESFTYFIPDAMLEGAVLVASDSGAQSGIISNGVDGLLVPAGDAAALAGVLRKVVADESLRGQMAWAARDKAEKYFGYEDFFSNMLAIYSGK